MPGFLCLSVLSLLFFSAVFNSPVYIVQERLRAPEDLQYIIYIQAGIIIDSGKAEVLQLDVFYIRSLRIESEWSTLELLVLVK